MSVPSLDELLRDPAQVHQLSRQERGELLVRAAAVVACLAACEVAEPPASAPEGDVMLTVVEACALLRCEPRWIWRNKRRLGFVRQTGPRSLLCSKRGIENWLAARRAH